MASTRRSSSSVNIQQWFLLVAVLSLLTGWTYTSVVFDTQYLGNAVDDKIGNSSAEAGISGVASGSDFSSKAVSTNESSGNETIASYSYSYVLSAENVVSDTQQHIPKNPSKILDCHQNTSSCVFFKPSTYFATAASPLPSRILDQVEHYWSNKYNPTTSKDLFYYSIQKDVGVYNLLEWNSNVTSPPLGWPRTMMGLHIHKCGGSSVSRVFLKTANSGNNTTNQFQLTLFYKNDLRAKFGQSSWEQQSLEMHTRLLRRVLDDQHPEGPTDHVAFTFVRDPVERFLSSIREFLVSRNRKKRLCLDSKTDKEVLQCFLSKLQQGHGLQMDQHFAPISVSLYMFALIEPRIRISILPLTKETMSDFSSCVSRPATTHHQGQVFQATSIQHQHGISG